MWSAMIDALAPVDDAFALQMFPDAYRLGTDVVRVSSYGMAVLGDVYREAKADVRIPDGEQRLAQAILDLYSYRVRPRMYEYPGARTYAFQTYRALGAFQSLLDRHSLKNLMEPLVEVFVQDPNLRIRAYDNTRKEVAYGEARLVPVDRVSAAARPMHSDDLAAIVSLRAITAIIGAWYAVGEDANATVDWIFPSASNGMLGVRLNISGYHVSFWTGSYDTSLQDVDESKRRALKYRTPFDDMW